MKKRAARWGFGVGSIAIWIALGCWTATVFARDANDLPLHSALRYPGESVQSAIQRYRQRLVTQGWPRPESSTSALEMAVPIKDLHVQPVPELPSVAKLTEAFSRARDVRFLEDPIVPGFARRSSWMYPDDGCFARAALAAHNLYSWGYGAPMKAFIFGSLTVKSPNSPRGSVSWWYHVVPVYRIGQSIGVVDPAIDPRHPLPFMEWVAQMVPDPATVKVALCAAPAYGPASDCMHPDPSGDQRARTDQALYLRAERDRLVELKRDPDRELGDFPPWGGRLISR